MDVWEKGFLLHYGDNQVCWFGNMIMGQNLTVDYPGYRICMCNVKIVADGKHGDYYVIVVSSLTYFLSLVLGHNNPLLQLFRDAIAILALSLN